jgi:hypothetical protein
MGIASDKVNILIRVANQGIDVLEPSVVAATHVKNHGLIMLTFGKDRPDLEELAQLYGLEYAVNDELPARAQYEPTLMIEAGEIPSPDCLDALTKIAIPQGIFRLPKSKIPVTKRLMSALSALGRNISADDNRGYQRQLERQKVSMMAFIAGYPASCIDIHARGGGFLMPRNVLRIDQEVPVSVDCRTMAGTIESATGTLLIKSLVRLTESGQTWRVGGPITWNTHKDQTLVLEHAFVSERFDKHPWQRATPRFPVSLPAVVSGIEAECIDLSEAGAAYVAKIDGVSPEDKLAVELVLDPALRVKGVLTVKGVNHMENDMIRMGGIMEWENKDWRKTYLPQD